MTESDAPLPVPAAGSHTSTAQWQNFEVRMRRRRAERCLMRADVAFAAGFLEDARAATDEARGLDPAWPAVTAMDERLAAAVSLPELMLRTDPVEVDVGAKSEEKTGRGFLLTVALAFASVALVAVASLGYRAGLDPIGVAAGSFRSDVTLAADPVVDAELEAALPVVDAELEADLPAPSIPEPVAPPVDETLAVQTSGMAEPAAAKAPALRDAGTNAVSATASRVVPSAESAHDPPPPRPSVTPPLAVNDATTRSPREDPDPVASLKPPAA